VHHTTILADDLHCNQPFCELLVSHGLDFIMTCKPDSHPTLYAEVERLTQVPDGVRQVEDRVWTGRFHERRTYRYISHVPLTAQPQTLSVNWYDLTITCEETGQVLYHNAWATNLHLKDRTVFPYLELLCPTTLQQRWTGNSVSFQAYQVVPRRLAISAGNRRMSSPICSLATWRL